MDADAGTINLEVAPETIRQRMAASTPPAPRYTSGVFAKYVALVASASEGAITVAPADAIAARMPR
jgi:dihydroxy-acid dehydratase